MNLYACARIATKKINRDRMDKMHDCILHVLEKGVADYPKNYVVRTMKNKLTDDGRKESVRQRVNLPESSLKIPEGISQDDFSTEMLLPVESETTVFDILRDVRPRDRLLLEWVGRWGVAQVAECLELSYDYVRNRYRQLQRRLR